VNLILRWLTAFAQFWYDFVIGDDWILAATVAAALVATWLLHSAGLAAWWLFPLYLHGPLAAADVVALVRSRASAVPAGRRT